MAINIARRKFIAALAGTWIRKLQARMCEMRCDADWHN
jgi:hypothetical protein